MFKQLTGGQLSTASTVSAETLSLLWLIKVVIKEHVPFFYIVFQEAIVQFQPVAGRNMKETDCDLRIYKTNKKWIQVLERYKASSWTSHFSADVANHSCSLLIPHFPWEDRHHWFWDPRPHWQERITPRERHKW